LLKASIAKTTEVLGQRKKRKMENIGMRVR